MCLPEKCRHAAFFIETEMNGTNRYMADLVIAFLQNYAAAAALFPLSDVDRQVAREELPEPMLPGNWDGATGACVHDDSLHLAAVQASVLPRPDLARRMSFITEVCQTGMRGVRDTYLRLHARMTCWTCALGLPRAVLPS